MSSLATLILDVCVSKIWCKIRVRKHNLCV